MRGPEGTVLVTGGTGALGHAVVGELLESGAGVLCTWLVDEERERAQDAFGGSDSFAMVEADLSGPEGAAAAAAAARPPLAAVVNLVGGYSAGGRVHEAPGEEMERMVELNLMTAHRTIRAALPVMVEQGEGSIVCVGSKAALEPFSGAAGYAVSKAAVIALARALAVEYRDDGIRANAVVPSVIDTPANRAAMPDADHSRWVQPAEIARVVRFLCSPESAVTSGAVIPVYGRAG